LFALKEPARCALVRTEEPAMKMPVAILSVVNALMASEEKVVRQVNIQYIMFILLLAYLLTKKMF
jgi:hypothetical protein